VAIADTRLASETQQRGRSSSVKSAERVLAVLELLARYARPVPTMAIARECGIPKSSAHHLLNVMRAKHFVTYYEDHRAWGLGVTVFEIGSAYLRSEPLQRLGRPLLAELTASLGETAHLAVLHGTDVLYVDKEQPSGGAATKLVTEVGVRLPAHLTAVGRAILAELTEPQVRALYADGPLVQRTGSGPSQLAELLDQLAGVRAAGHALEDGLTTPGISCLAAAVRSHEDRPVASIGVTYVTAQRSPDQVGDVAAEVRRVADRLSRSMGWLPGGAR
jgi:DNA-binding IclR family transcriptional regulator